MQDLMGQLAAGFIALIFGVQLVIFALRRRCPRCRRPFGGRFESAHLSDVSTRRAPVDPLEQPGIFGRKMQTITSGTRHVSVRCRRCGHRWGYSGRYSDSRADP